jgi:tetratricopeptide (TPR) repeat protein
MGTLADLEEALRCWWQAVQITPPNSPDLPSRLSNLGAGLLDRYNRMGALADLEEAVRVSRQAVQVTPPDSPDLPGHLNNLGLGLRARYTRTGALADLEEAVYCWQQAVAHTLTDSLNLPTILNNLGSGLLDRYERTGALADLEEAVRCLEQAVQITPPDSPELPMFLNNLGLGLCDRYERTGALADLEEAVRCWQQAVQVTPPNSPAVPTYLSSLGAGLHDRYTRTGVPADLEEAVRCLEQAVQRTPPDSPTLSMFLNNLGAGLYDRYERTRELADREGAVRCFEQAVQVTPPDSPDMPGYLNNLGAGLRDRYDRTGAPADLEEAVRIHQDALQALDRAFLPSPVAYQLGQQANWAGLVARAVDVLLLAGAPAQALAAAEGSKSRLLSTLVGRGNVAPPLGVPGDLLAQEREQAARLADLDAVALARHGQLTTAEESARYHADRRALLDGLSSLWQDFAAYGPQAAAYVALRRGDRPAWEDLVRLADRLGPETPLLSLFTTGSRTLLFVLRAGMAAPEVVETGLDGAGWNDLLGRFLREVYPRNPCDETWRTLLRPLLEAVEPHLAGAQRLVFAPQAGGHYLPWGALYATPLVTIPALGLLGQLWERPTGTGDGALVVGNPFADCPRHKLPAAEREAREVAEMLGVTPLIGSQATKGAVLEQIGGVGLAHLATHAYFAPGSPLDSGILLADGVLTAREILERGLRAPEFLALSACQTGLAGSLGGDEVAGLSQALLYAGARTLLTSLWTVNDPATAHLMGGFYRNWRERGQDKAAALRNAMDETRQARSAWAHTRYWGAFTLVGDWR